MESWLNRVLFRLFPWALVLMLMSGILLVWSSYALYKARNYNDSLQKQVLNQDASEEAIFANAAYWAKHHDSKKSLMLYAQLQSSNDNALRRNVHYNIANHYLRQAYTTLNETGLASWDKVSPLLSIAKESYRDALRIDPSYMDAKYNYELALRLIPTIESKSQRMTESEDDLETPPEGWPAIPGFPRGMP